MSVSPMDLQVLFMQEHKAAEKSDKKRTFGKKMRGRISREHIYESQQTSVENVDAAEAKTTDEEGSQGSAGYFARRRQQQMPKEEQQDDDRPSEDGKGEQVDVTV